MNGTPLLIRFISTKKNPLSAKALETLFNLNFNNETTKNIISGDKLSTNIYLKKSYLSQYVICGLLSKNYRGMRKLRE